MPPDVDFSRSLQPALQAVVGYLNFSSGAPDPQFDRHLNELFAALEARPGGPPARVRLGQMLRDELARLHTTTAAFASTAQASAVLHLVFDRLLPRYREFHRDLLAHQSEIDLFRPLVLAKAFQAVLRQEQPWEPAQQIVDTALRSLNDFLGHRPVAVLRTAQKIEPYRHEWVGAIPLYTVAAGVATGRYQALIAETLEVLRATDRRILEAAQFDPDLLDELALDPRAYDFDHPVHKRPNYQFGQWDPHSIDNSGRYRRFVLQTVTLETILERALETQTLPSQEMMREAAVVLAGTMLMASGVSGRGPEAYDSSTTLSNLMPRIAAYRDEYYVHWLANVPGEHGERLRTEATHLKQPFGAARQDLNQRLARLRAAQLQHVRLAKLFAEMGNLEASLRQARIVPVASARMLSEIGGRITIGHLALRRGDIASAVSRLHEVEDLIKRAIQCGAVVDPWNILGFQGQFSIFQSLENSVRDHRVDVLIHVMTATFGLIVQTIAADSGSANPVIETQGPWLNELVEWWDRFATQDVSDVESISGRETLETAQTVATALSAWRAGGAATGDMGFWRQHVADFQSPKTFALAIEALIKRQDYVASMGLLVQWLSEADRIALAEGEDSFHRLALRWLAAVVDQGDTATGLASKFFDYLEANAGPLWEVPSLGLGTDEARPAPERPRAAPNADVDDPADDEAPEDLFGAAYEGVTYLDSTDDGFEGATLESGESAGDYELDLAAARLQRLLAFHRTLARMRTLAAQASRPVAAAAKAGEPAPPVSPVAPETLSDQLAHAVAVERRLADLLAAVHRFRVPPPQNTPTAFVEYDRRRRVKDGLTAEVVQAAVEASAAVRWLRAATDDSAVDAAAPWTALATPVLRAILQGDAAAVAESFPALRESLDLQPILFVPLSRGGEPQLLLQTHAIKQLIVELLQNLPRLGLLAETCRLIATAQSMERHRPVGERAVTEFDRLLETGYRAMVESLADSAAGWQVAAPDEPGEIAIVGSASHPVLAPTDAAVDSELVECLQVLTEPLLIRWLEHSRSVRLSVLERIAEPDRFAALVDFIQRYGHDLFTQSFFNLGNLRAIAEQGAATYLKMLEVDPDPLRPIGLIDDLDQGIPRAKAAEHLQTIVEAVIENYAEYKDFNTTTTQSDRGELLYLLLDFLRLKASYERVCWNIRPLVVAHEVLMRRGRKTAAEIWRRMMAERTADTANWHLTRLNELVAQHRMRLGSVAARLAERFVAPLAADRLRSLIAPAMAEIRCGLPAAAFELLEQEVAEFADQPSSSTLEVPAWLAALEDEAARVQATFEDATTLNALARRRPAVRLSRTEVEQQLRAAQS